MSLKPSLRFGEDLMRVFVCDNLLSYRRKVLLRKSQDLISWSPWTMRIRWDHMAVVATASHLLLHQHGWGYVDCNIEREICWSLCSTVVLILLIDALTGELQLCDFQFYNTKWWQYRSQSYSKRKAQRPYWKRRCVQISLLLFTTSLFKHWKPINTLVYEGNIVSAQIMYCHVCIGCPREAKNYYGPMNGANCVDTRVPGGSYDVNIFLVEHHVPKKQSMVPGVLNSLMNFMSLWM